MAKKIYLTIFLIICLVPSVFMLILGPSRPGANEILSPAPEMGVNVLDEAADYIGDRFAFRKELISCYSWLGAKVFNISVVDKVILGRNGELYYASDIDDYTGVHLTDEELAAICERLKTIQTGVEARGGTFVFTIAPNKSSVHGENMPAYLENRHGESNAARLEILLEEYGINYVNLFDSTIPYYRNDSHWTEKGAAMACDALIGTDYSAAEFLEGPDVHKGDLYDMLYPSFAGSEKAFSYGGEFTYALLNDDNGGNAVTIETDGNGDRTLFCWRDSFGITLYPYLADATSHAVFSRSTSFDEANTGDADIVILEIVERNISYLK